MLREGHWAHQPSKTYYNGVAHVDITNPSAKVRNGIDSKKVSHEVRYELSQAQ